MKPNCFPRKAIAKNDFALPSRYTWDTPYRVWFDLDNSLTRRKRPIFKIRYSRNSQISVWKANFFPRQAIPKIPSVLDSRHPWYTQYPVWFTLDNSLTRRKRPVFKIRYSRNSQISVWKPNFFPRKAIAEISFALHSRYTWDTPYRVWFGLDTSLTRRKRPFFKIRYSRNSQISVWKANFFPRQAIPKIPSVLDSRHPWYTQYPVWFTLDNSLTWRKRPVFKIRYSRNSQISVWKPNFFPRKAIAEISFALHSRYTWDTPYRVWFGLDTSLTRRKRPFFKIRYSRNSQISVWKANFFPRQAIPKIPSVLDSRHPWYTHYSVWFTLDTSLTRRKRPFCKIRYSRNSQISVWKANFFPMQAILKIPSVLDSRHPWYTQYPVWFTLDNSLTWRKRPIFKIRYSRNSQIFVWKPNFFPGKAIAKTFFALHSRYTWDTPYRVWFDLGNSLTRRKRPIFKIRYSRNSQISVWKANFFPRQAIPKIPSVLASRHPWYTQYPVCFTLDNSLTRRKRPIFKIRYSRN